MEEGLTVSINPSYFCNFRCDFCYLTKEQLGDPKLLDLDKLDILLSNLPEVKHVDLYGGEIGLLKEDYVNDLLSTIRKKFDGKINIVTNYSIVKDWFHNDDLTLAVSYDFEAREKSEQVFKNMLLSSKPIALLILASPKVLEMDVGELIQQLNMCSSITSVEIKPYSTNQANQHPVTHKDFEEFVKRFIDSEVDKNFDFINLDKIEDSLDGIYNAFSDDHIYITPNGKYGVLEFDLNDNEFFLELDSYEDYLKWTQKEKASNVSSICKNCKYFGNCLTEHYRFVKDLDSGCNGYKGLLDWYAGMED